MQPDDLFQGHTEAKRLFQEVCALLDGIGPMQLGVTKSQVAFRRKKGFAWVWMPEMYLKRKAAPLVLSIGLHRRDPSPRWKQVVEPYPGRFIHHLELYSERDLDEEMQALLAEAWEIAR